MGALRQMKDSLLHSKLDYQGQINAIAKVQGVIECSLDGDVTNANDIFLNLLGYSLEEVKGKNYSMFGWIDEQGSLAGAAARREPAGRVPRDGARQARRLVPGRVQSDRRRFRKTVQGRRLSE